MIDRDTGKELTFEETRRALDNPGIYTWIMETDSESMS